MSNSVTIIGLRDLRKKLSYFRHDLTDRKVLSDIAEYVIYRIQTRTQEGIDADETSFRPYSEEYALFRSLNQRRIDIVNLTWSGTMLSAMTYDVEPGGEEVSIFFENVYAQGDEISVPEKAYFLNEDREFFAMNEDDRNMALNIVKRHIRKLKRKK